GNYGYNAATGEYGDMVAMGILDPTKVTRCALQNAASIAGLMVTTAAMVTTDGVARMSDMGGAGEIGGGWGPGGKEVIATMGYVGGAGAYAKYVGGKGAYAKRGVTPGAGGSRAEEADAAEGGRYLMAKYPRPLACGKEETVNVRIGMEPGGAAATLLKHFEVPAEGAEVALQLLAEPGLELCGPISTQVLVPRKGNTPWMGFDVIARSEGTHRLWVTAIFKAEEIGTLQLALEAVAGDEQHPEKLEKAAISTDRAFDAHGGMLCVHYDRNHKRYSLSWYGPKVNLPDDSCETLDADSIFETIERSIAEIEGLVRDSYSVATPLMNRQMTGKGIALWNEIVPREIRAHYLAHHAAYQRIQIISSGDPVPWELLVPQDTAPGSAQSEPLGFWGDIAELRHWFPGTLPASRLDVRRAVVLTARDAPPLAEAEAKGVADLLGRAGVQVERVDDISALFEVLDAGETNLLHIACHGAHTVDSGDSFLKINNVPFRPNDLLPSRGRFSRTPLTVFLNACRTEVVRPSYLRLDGWAARFRDVGADVFIGTLWEVGDHAAKDFALAFYRELVRETGGLDSALKAGRHAARAVGNDPTWLAYSVYAGAYPKIRVPIPQPTEPTP
ncbi:hypothetical protein CKO22_16585, partial [Thiococcus pfennigii]|nr:hypothetical protein [Thiococcus pfennigii]